MLDLEDGPREFVEESRQRPTQIEVRSGVTGIRDATRTRLDRSGAPLWIPTLTFDLNSLNSSWLRPELVQHGLIPALELEQLVRSACSPRATSSKPMGSPPQARRSLCSDGTVRPQMKRPPPSTRRSPRSRPKRWPSRRGKTDAGGRTRSSLEAVPVPVRNIPSLARLAAAQLFAVAEKRPPQDFRLPQPKRHSTERSFQVHSDAEDLGEGPSRPRLKPPRFGDKELDADRAQLLVGRNGASACKTQGAVLTLALP